MMEDIEEMITTLTKQRERLKIVHSENIRKMGTYFFELWDIKNSNVRIKLEMGPNDPLLDSIDMMSDTSSMATSRITGTGTGMTGASFRSYSSYVMNLLLFPSFFNHFIFFFPHI